MANKSSLVITATDITTGRAQQKTITDINPQASSSHLLTWAQMTAGLTKDGYIKSKRVDVIELDDGARARPVSEILVVYQGGSIILPLNGECVANLTTDQIIVNNSRPILSLRVTTAIDSVAPQFLNPVATGTTVTPYTLLFNFSGMRWAMDWYLPEGAAPACSFSFTVHFDATNQYDAYDKDITINITEEG